MRKINLSNITTKLINLDKDIFKLQNCTTILNKIKLPFDRFPAVYVKPTESLYGPTIKGCGLSHLTLLKSTTTPILILEDDIEITDKFKLEFIVPSEADAIYLGVSNHGTIRGNYFGYPGIVSATTYNPSFKQVFNMCSTHAILYLTDKYREAASNIIKKYLDNNIAFDVGLSHLHKDFVILTPNEPWFYQHTQPNYTNLVLEV